ncbi:MAG: sugar ABC transporter permease [Candidatus Omnitrophica bacterium]|nr:sugar ABC transporter permease [Candidatus Omnitrophota bacterium]
MKLSLTKKRNEMFYAYLFLVPNLIGFLVFTFFPVVASLLLSFIKYRVITLSWPLDIEFIGLTHFIKLLGFHRETAGIVANDPLFWKFLWNTAYLMCGIPAGMAGSLMLAIVLNRKQKGIVFFRTLFFLPSMCLTVAVALLWVWIYNFDYGILNTFIRGIGDLFNFNLEGVHWLSAEWIKLSMIIACFWTFLGGHNMILYLAALQNIPKALYEAADIDGATKAQKFWAVTWPMISPTTFFISIMSIIGGFQGGFMFAYIFARGGPHQASTTLMYYIFNNFFEWNNFGYACCIAWFMFVLIFAVTIFNWRFGGKLVHYS